MFFITLKLAVESIIYFWNLAKQLTGLFCNRPMKNAFRISIILSGMKNILLHMQFKQVIKRQRSRTSVLLFLYSNKHRCFSAKGQGVLTLIFYPWNSVCFCLSSGISLARTYSNRNESRQNCPNNSTFSWFQECEIKGFKANTISHPNIIKFKSLF